MRSMLSVSACALFLLTGCQVEQRPPQVPPPTAPAPSPRFSAAAAYDGARREVVLFGGAAQDASLADTWTWDGRHWTRHTPAHAPPPRAWAEMAYDPVHRTVVLFGGSRVNGPMLDDTWLWDGRDWNQARPTFVPSPTVEEGMTFFSGTHSVLLYGVGHLYSWDGQNWKDLFFTGGPQAFQGGLSVDPVRAVVVLLAADVNGLSGLRHWEFDGRKWTSRDVPPPRFRSLVQTVTDEREQTIVMFGGLDRNDTWTWDGARWTERHPAHSPSIRSSTGPMPILAYDAARGQVVLFGGWFNGPPNESRPLNDTWTWSGGDWHPA